MRDYEHPMWGRADDHKRLKRELMERKSGCLHVSKIAEGNVVRCGVCKKIVGFIRDPKATTDAS